MDPEANLQELRRLRAKFFDIVNETRLGEPFTLEEGADDLVRFLELVEALDEWVTKGGFLPREWTAHRKTEQDLGDLLEASKAIISTRIPTERNVRLSDDLAGAQARINAMAKLRRVVGRLTEKPQ